MGVAPTLTRPQQHVERDPEQQHRTRDHRERDGDADGVALGIRMTTPPRLNRWRELVIGDHGVTLLRKLSRRRRAPGVSVYR